MAEQFFNKIADDVMLAAEQLQSLLTTGDLTNTAADNDGGASSNDDSSGSGPDTSGDSGSYSHDFDFSDLDLDGMSEDEIQELLADEMMQNNPLQGIADDVTKNIMAGQGREKETGHKTEEERRLSIDSILFLNWYRSLTNFLKLFRLSFICVRDFLLSLFCTMTGSTRVTHGTLPCLSLGNQLVGKIYRRIDLFSDCHVPVVSFRLEKESRIGFPGVFVGVHWCRGSIGGMAELTGRTTLGILCDPGLF